MTSKLGFLGPPRVAIALLWFVDGGAHRSGEPAGPVHPSGPTPPPPVTPEDTELVRSLTGLTPVELVARLQDIAAGYERDPAVLRAELLRITGGDEIAVEHLMQLIHAATPRDDMADADRLDEKSRTSRPSSAVPGDEAADVSRAGEAGRVIPLPRHVPGIDDEGDDP
jgi:hypothetical protein